MTHVMANGHEIVVQAWSGGGVTIADPANPQAGNPAVLVNLQAGELVAFVQALRHSGYPSANDVVLSCQPVDAGVAVSVLGIVPPLFTLAAHEIEPFVLAVRDAAGS